MVLIIEFLELNVLFYLIWHNNIYIYQCFDRKRICNDETTAWKYDPLFWSNGRAVDRATKLTITFAHVFI